jgi:nitrite reductase (NO-forming)
LTCIKKQPQRLPDTRFIQKENTMKRLLLACTLAALAAHAQGKPDAPVLDSPASKTTAERHTGKFAEGASLSFGAKLNPLDSAPVKTVRLDTTHKIIEIAPGVKFSAWTFGDAVPGPTVRARVGDRIRFSMTNRSDEPAPGVRLTAAPMMHSMDFHAAMVSPQDKYHSIAPGQTIEFEFVVNYPGVFMYHCGTPMILEHIASGMYGAVVVEPREGYPTKVDREYIVIQSEFYAKPRDGRSATALHEHGKASPEPKKAPARASSATGEVAAGIYVLDSDRLRNSQPTYTVFNGVHNGMVKNPLVAKPGERVRLFVLNVGPSRTSSFHVVGTIFDRVWLEGNPRNEMHGMQTVLLGSSNSAIVEFMIPEKGSYIMVDHHFANASQGAIGLIDAGGKSEEADLEHHNMPASATPTDPEAIRGKLSFESKCLACHSLGGGKKLGPDLAGVTKRRTEAWLVRWLKSPEKMLESDADARAMLKEYNNLPMPNQNLPEAEIREYLKYFKWYDEQGAAAPKGEANAH